MKSANWNRKQSANPTATEINFFRLVDEDEGCQERAEKLLGKQLDAEKIQAAQAAFCATWTAEVFATRRAQWNNSTIMPIPAREKALGFKLADLISAKSIYGN